MIQYNLTASSYEGYDSNTLDCTNNAQVDYDIVIPDSMLDASLTIKDGGYAFPEM